MSNQSENTFNYGITLLRMLMCFEVVLCHFWKEDAVSVLLLPFQLMKGLAVPIFMFLAFYFSEKVFLESDYLKIKKRFLRITWPQIGWAFIYWGIYSFIQQILKYDMGVTFTSLIWQIITGHGHSLNPSMWFQTDLIIITLIFFAMVKGANVFLHKITLAYIYILLCVIALIFQISGLNIWLFGSLQYELRNPLGRICEMIPYASIGCICAHYNIFEKMKEKRLFYIIVNCCAFLLFVFLTFILLKYHIIASEPGFGYAHPIGAFLSFFLIAIAYLLPFEILSVSILEIIKAITKYTLGIYCMHYMIATILVIILPKFDLYLNNFLLCIVVYVLCFAISFLFSRIPCKYLKQLVE